MARERVPEQTTSAKADTPFEMEPAHEYRPAYGRGGPVRSGEPERDYYLEGKR